VHLLVWRRGGDNTQREFAYTLTIFLGIPLTPYSVIFDLNFKRLEFNSLLGVAVATTPKGRRTAAPPLGTPAAPNSAKHSITN